MMGVYSRNGKNCTLIRPLSRMSIDPPKFLNIPLEREERFGVFFSLHVL